MAVIDENEGEDAPVSDRNVLILDNGMVGEVYDRGMFVVKSSRFLFGFNFADSRRRMMTREINSIGLDVFRLSCTADVPAGVKQSTKVRRRVLEGYRSPYQHYAKIAPEFFGEDVLKLVKEQNTVMYPEMVMVSHRNVITGLVTDLKGLVIADCAPFSDEGTTQVIDSAEICAYVETGSGRRAGRRRRE
ncbi:unnamed protein product [Ascophyllum nodosum]